MNIAFLAGAFAGTFLISRLFWLATKPWPNSLQKAVVLNVFCALIVIPLDYIAREDSPWITEVEIYGGCQVVVFLIDYLAMRGRRAQSRNPQAS